ncbi:MAG: alginate export family protein [Planctomycetaceae bacterium]
MPRRNGVVLLLISFALSQTASAQDSPSHTPAWVSASQSVPVPSSDVPTEEESPVPAAEPAPVLSDVDELFSPDSSCDLGTCNGALSCDGLGCDGMLGCDGCGTGKKECGGCLLTGCGEDDCFICSDKPLLHDYRGQTLFGDVKYSMGGELRYRYMDERNRLRPMGNVRRDTYQLWRFSPFLEVGNDWIKGYVQAIDASAFNEDLPILPIDENRWDLLQYYVDVRLLQLESGDVRGQAGRIFLQYGDQHLISPLGWSNTYRNFEGGKLYYSGEDWNIDGFVVRPNNGAASAAAFHPHSFDQADQSITFSGIYATYKKAKNGTIDLFWLWNDQSEPVTTLQDGNRHTIGARYAGTYADKTGDETILTYMWDLQGGYQFGRDVFMPVAGEQDVNAGFLSTIGGVTFNQVAWSPSIKGLFWWGSGDDDPTDGEINTVNTLYPLGHAYWGLIDNFNGANLIDYSIQASVQPAKKLNLAAHYHWFDKASQNDYIYNIAGASLGNTATPQKTLGNELDLLATYQVNANLQLQAGYFWFWYGDAVDNQAALARDDAHQFYFMTTWGF